eukprot:1214919-Ditylum_brightwellii.AAC.1
MLENAQCIAWHSKMSCFHWDCGVRDTMLKRSPSVVMMWNIWAVFGCCHIFSARSLFVRCPAGNKSEMGKVDS